ncbi:MAG: CBS domain-containing protein [Tissierellia bacterium]|nr:CBS domain-containing protein [Tissierellia bacterium]
MDSRNSERFIQTYNRIDNYMRKYLDKDSRQGHLSVIKEMVKKGHPIFTKEGRFLEECAELRNAIVHEYGVDNIRIIAEPHDDIVEAYEEIYQKISDPPLAYNELAIWVHHLVVANLDSSTKKIIELMNAKDYTQIPILDEEGKLFGVFSENVLVSYLADLKLSKNGYGQVEIRTLRDFEDYLPIDSHAGEFYDFIALDVNVYEVKDIFVNHEYRGNKKLAGLFVTQHGRPEEVILGFISPWNMVTYPRD